MSILGAGDSSSAIALQECVLHTSLRRLHAVHGRPCLTDYTSTVLTKPPGRCQALQVPVAAVPTAVHVPQSILQSKRTPPSSLQGLLCSGLEMGSAVGPLYGSTIGTLPPPPTVEHTEVLGGRPRPHTLSCTPSLWLSLECILYENTGSQ